MSVSSEEGFRNLLDESGIVRWDALSKVSLDRSSGAYTVFAQRSDAILPIDALKSQAARFFRAKLGLTVEKKYGSIAAPESDAARIVLAMDDGSASGTRLCFGRRADASDHAAAEEAERLQNTNGMSLLAQRCQAVWLVQIEAPERAVTTSENGNEDPSLDRVSLTIAAILASSFLGPILTPRGDELFGVRTARMKLEGGRASPYR